MILENRVAGEKLVVGMETTVFVHGLPRKEAMELFRKAKEISEKMGFRLAVVGVLKGKIIVGMKEKRPRHHDRRRC